MGEIPIWMDTDAYQHFYYQLEKWARNHDDVMSLNLGNHGCRLQLHGKHNLLTHTCREKWCIIDNIFSVKHKILDQNCWNKSCKLCDCKIIFNASVKCKYFIFEVFEESKSVLCFKPSSWYHLFCIFWSCYRAVQ